MTGNLAHLPHDVIQAANASGTRINGKLSDFKTPETAHLWRDEDTPPMPRKKPPRTAKQAESDEKKRGRGNTGLTQKTLRQNANKSWGEYKAEMERLSADGWYNMQTIAAMTGAQILKLRRMYYDGIITQVRQSKVRSSAVFVRLDEVEKLLKGEVKYD